MSQGGYSHTTRATGTVLTSAIYNNDHTNHITNQNPQMTGGYSDNVTQMQLITDPGSLGAESLTTTLAGEIERIRYQLKLITGEPQWYVAPAQNLKTITTVGIADGSLALTKLVNTTQGHLLGRAAAGTGPWQEFLLSDLANLVPTSNDMILGVPAAGGAPRNILVKDIVGNVPIPVQGRLTVTASTPVPIAAATGQNTIRFTPYYGLIVPIWNGTNIAPANTGGELSQLTTDNTKSPAATIANKNYDIFFWMDGATPRISRGWPWSSDAVRGTGASTAELVRVAGMWVNAQAITNGPAAQRGTYLGTIRTNASALIDWSLGSNAANFGTAHLCVWNFYNRVHVAACASDSGGFYAYQTNNWRTAGGTNGGRINFVLGFQEDGCDAHYISRLQTTNVNATFAFIGLQLDLTTGQPPDYAFANNNVPSGATVGHQIQAMANWISAYSANPTLLGFHFLQAMESGDGSVSNFNVGPNAQAIRGRFMM